MELFIRNDQNKLLVGFNNFPNPFDYSALVIDIERCTY
jgi:hypothetical protein